MEDNILFEKPKVRLIAYTNPPSRIGSDRSTLPEATLDVLRQLSVLSNTYCDEEFEEKRNQLFDDVACTIARDTAPKPDAIPTAGALGCFEEASSAKFLDDLIAMSEDERNKKVEGVLANSAGMGHGSVSDQNYFIFSIENLPRAATLQLCLPEYLSHLQQSLRRAKADRGFYIPPAIKESKLFLEVKKTLLEAFDLYGAMQAAGIPGEDARYHLPLYTKTNIQSSGDVRELQHLHAMNQQGEVPSIVKETVEAIIAEGAKVAPAAFENREKNYETLAWRPSAQLFSSENKTLNDLIESNNHPQEVCFISYNGFDISEEAVEKAVKKRDEAELSNLKHIHFEFLVPMSLVTYHQATRQRTWNHALQPIYDAAEKAKLVLPPSIDKSSFRDEYLRMGFKMHGLYEQLIGSGIPRAEAVGVLPHSLIIYDFIHVDGWNAIHSIGKRTCKNAQWEIRGIANKMAEYIRRENPAIGKYSVPQGIIYGKCPEKKSCGYCEAYLAKKQE